MTWYFNTGLIRFNVDGTFDYQLDGILCQGKWFWNPQTRVLRFEDTYLNGIKRKTVMITEHFFKPNQLEEMSIRMLVFPIRVNAEVKLTKVKD